eukprot:scaffold12293_cov120-Skeletonema_marinoi.AAC.12
MNIQREAIGWQGLPYGSPPSSRNSSRPLRQRRGSRLVEGTLIITICCGILSLCKLEPLARNSVPSNSVFKMSNNAAPVAGVERVGSKKKEESLDTGWFASVKALGPDDLTAEFKKRFENIFELRRGGGYWIWKFDVIEQTLGQIKEGDFLVYLDAGSQVNKGGEKRFREYLKIVNESQYDMLCFEYPWHAEYKWTTEKIFRAFNVSMEDPIRLSGQIEGGTLLMQKGPHLRSWLKIIKDILLQDPWLITDKYNDESKALTPDFNDNRHDQSLSSLSRKIHGCEMLSADDESNSGASDKPFHVMRMRKPS